jgi:hypothetical protein
MIFGFNTDIRREGTIYHVQSEAREAEQLLQTQVFVQGRCIGKRAVPYDYAGREEKNNSKSEAVQNSGIPNSDQDREKALRELHREVLDAIRDGKLSGILDKRDTETLAAVKELDLEWTNAGSVHSSGALTMHIRVTDGGVPVARARLTLRFVRQDAAPYYAQVVTDAAGNAEMSVQVEEASLSDSSVLVQVSYAGRTVTRKFRLRNAS